MNPCQIYAEFRPRKGQPISYQGKFSGTVTAVEGGLCWHTGDLSGPFIWCFRDGLNAMHSWPGKDESRNCRCPGYIAPTVQEQAS